MSTSLLRGICVIGMCEVWAGPMGASLLGDLGASVGKVESYPRPPTITRPLREGTTAPGDGPPYERSAGHHLANRNKRGMTLNIRSESGREVLDRLLCTTDVFI